MGDLQTDQGESLDLHSVPAGEFQRLLGATGASAQDRAAAIAALARINALYMITGAWSGHIGTSFSSLDIMSWLFLNELRDLDKGDAACDIFFSSKGHDAPALYSVLLGLGLLPEDKVQATGGSSTVRAFEGPARQAGAAARALLCLAAAERWDADWRACDTEAGFVTRGDDRLRFGELAQEAAGLRLPDDIPLRTGGGVNRLTGRGMNRLDIPAKIDGSANYAGDIRLPDMVGQFDRRPPAGAAGRFTVEICRQGRRRQDFRRAPDRRT